MSSLVEDFGHIAAELKRIEEEKARVLSVPLPDVQPIYAEYETSLAQSVIDGLYG